MNLLLREWLSDKAKRAQTLVNHIKLYDHFFMCNSKKMRELLKTVIYEAWD